MAVELWASPPRCVAERPGGRVAPASPRPQPFLGFPAETSLISDLLICMMSFWVLEIEPSCPALPCSVLQGPRVGLILRILLLRALLSEAPGRLLSSLCSPLQAFWGPTFAELSRVT